MHNLKTVRDYVQSRRNEYFFGRTDELQQLDTFYLAPPPKILYLHGSNGIGKTSLLKHWLQEQKIDQSDTLWIDAKKVSCDLEAISGAMSKARTFTSDGTLVVVDDFHLWADLEFEVLDKVISALPRGVRFIFCTRYQPHPWWLKDCGWLEITRFLHLGDLPENECRALLDRLDTPDSLRNMLLTLTNGNPASLILAASLSVQDPDPTCERAWLRNFANETGMHLTNTSVEEPLWRALEYCAVAGFLDEQFLSSVAEFEAADELMAGLLRQNYMHSDNNGLNLHTLAWRMVYLRGYFANPKRLQEIADTSLVEHLNRASLYGGPNRWSNAFRNLAQSFDTVAVGLNPLRAAYWCRSSMWSLQQSRAVNQSNTAEPIASAGETLPAWERVTNQQTVLLSDPQNTQIFLRRSCCADGSQAIASAFGVPRAYTKFEVVMPTVPPDLWRNSGGWFRHIFLATLALHICQSKGTATVLVMPSEMVFPSIEALPHVVTYQNDSVRTKGFRALLICPVACEQENIHELLHVLQGEGFKSIAAPSLQSLEEDSLVFKNSAIEALKQFSDARSLANNPIITSSSLLSHQQLDPADPMSHVSSLRSIIEETISEIASSPNNRKYEQVLSVAYISPRRQKTAANELNMAYSSFRRHLHDAREILCEELWQKELQARHIAIRAE